MDAVTDEDQSCITSRMQRNELWHIESKHKVTRKESKQKNMKTRSSNSYRMNTDLRGMQQWLQNNYAEKNPVQRQNRDILETEWLAAHSSFTQTQNHRGSYTITRLHHASFLSFAVSAEVVVLMLTLSQSFFMRSIICLRELTLPRCTITINSKPNKHSGLPCSRSRLFNLNSSRLSPCLPALWRTLFSLHIVSILS